MIFRTLTETEKSEFRAAARRDFIAGENINYDAWHPVYCAECDLINLESIRQCANGGQLDLFMRFINVRDRIE